MHEEDHNSKTKKGKGIVKRLTIFVSLVTILFTLSSSSLNKKSKDHFRINTRITKRKIEYNSGTIYIGDEKYLETIKEIGIYDVLVLDNRNMDDPNFRIYDSYRIIDPDIREEIIEGLLLYEKEYPSKWNRTKNSLIREWAAHNLMYRLGYKQGRTTDVDLNNKDEETYRIKTYLIH